MELPEKGLFASLTPSGEVLIESVGITAQEFLVLLAALEGTAEQIVEESE